MHPQIAVCCSMRKSKMNQNSTRSLQDFYKLFYKILNQTSRRISNGELFRPCRSLKIQRKQLQDDNKLRRSATYDTIPRWNLVGTLLELKASNKPDKTLSMFEGAPPMIPYFV